MFPLNWNIPFIRKNGSRTTLGAITGDIAGIEEDVSELTEKTDGLWDNMMDNGAVNLLPYPYNNTTKTTNGITYTDNEDGTISANGTSTALATFFVATNLHISKATKITGCPSGGADGSYALEVYNSTKSTRIGYDTGNGFVIPAQDATDNIAINIQIWNGQTVSNLVFKPMISDPSLNLSYDDYVPYAMTNRELTTPVYFNLSVRNDRCTIDEQSNFRIGKQVYIRCKFTPIVSGTDLPILTIPEGYRPKALGSNDVGVALNLVPKYNNADRTNFMWALAFATGEVDCLTLSQNNAYLLCGTYFLE